MVQGAMEHRVDLFSLPKEASLVDLKTGTTIWQGAAQASSSENQQQQQGGLAAVLISAVSKQVLASTFDDGHRYAGIATDRLLATGVPNNGLLYGPRSPNFQKD